jgi:tRNA A37 threonylcarbamoyladenosine modification protein TsaB
MPVVDARRGEVFVLQDEPRVLAPAALHPAPGTLYVGNGAVRYRSLLEGAGAEIPPDQDDRHVPRARFHAALARDFGPAEAVEPMYLRVPDADKTTR